MKIVRRHIGILFLVFIFFLTTTVSPALAETTDQDQKVKDFGDVTNILLRHDMVFVIDPALGEYFNGIIQTLNNANKLSNTYRVKVVNDLVPNSFSGPDGIIYITTGLLDSLQSKSELAFVFAHEIAHVETSDQFDTFVNIKRKRIAAITAATALAIVLMVVTVGASAAAMGPMATATTSSTIITNVGVTASMMAMEAGTTTPRVGKLDKIENFTKVRFGKVGASTEGQHHSVYAPALFGSLIKGIYEGYGQKKEIDANNTALQYLSQAGYPTTGGQSIVSRLVDVTPESPRSHLEAFFKELVQKPTTNESE